MPLIFLDAYETWALNFIASRINADGATLHLYKNNYVPVDGSVLANFTECDFSGYAATPAVFGFSAEIAGKAVMTDAGPRTFAHNGGGTANNVYGYYVLDVILNLVMWAERFAAPVNMTAVPDQITITARLTLDSESH